MPATPNNLTLAIAKALGPVEHAIRELLGYKPFRGKAKPEAAICLTFFAEMKRRILNKQFKGLVFHLANEGKRAKTSAALVRAMGLIPGLPDYLVMWRDNDELKVCFIEFKAPKGKESPYQAFFATWAESIQVRRALCYSSEEALALLDELSAFG